MSVLVQNGAFKMRNKDRGATTCKVNCACCPYGYHIDLDFINYCEQLNNLTPSEGQLRRRNRRQRQSMEVMLGLQQQQQNIEYYQAEKLLNEVQNELRNHNNFKSQAPTPPPRAAQESPIVPHYNHHPYLQGESKNLYSTLLVDDEALYDFERTLERSKKSKNTERKSPGRKFHQQCSIIEETLESPKASDCIPNHQKKVMAPPVPPKKHHYTDYIINQCNQSGFPTDLGNRLYDEPNHSRETLDENVDKISVVSNGSNGSEVNATALQQVREQMAFSLKRMRDLEEQVKLIPLLQMQLQGMKEDRRQLQLQLKAEEIKSTSSSLSSSQPQIFQPQRVSPVSLTSLNKHIRCLKNTGTSTSPVLRRDVGCSPIVQVSPAKLRCQATSTDLILPVTSTHSINERLYTEQEVKKSIELALYKYKKDKLAHTASTGTQISKSYRNVGTDSIVPIETPRKILTISKTKSINIIDKKSVASVSSNTDELVPQLLKKTSDISLKAITDFQATRSHSFNLGEGEEKKNILKRRTATTQTIASSKQSIGVQHVPRNESKSCQSLPPAQSATKNTDTVDLVKVRNSHANTDPILQKEQQSHTQDLVKMRDWGVNTVPIKESTPDRVAKAILKSSSSNTESVRTKEIGVSCNTETTVQTQKMSMVLPAGHSGEDSRIPRPSAFYSPSSQRKFVRQNTFVVSKHSKLPSPTSPSSTRHVVRLETTPEHDMLEQVCPAEALWRLSSQQNTLNTRSDIHLIKAVHNQQNVVIEAPSPPEMEDDKTEQYEVQNDDVSMARIPMSPSVEYLESNDDEYENDDYEEERQFARAVPHSLPPPPTSISMLRLSQPDRVKIKPSKEMRAALKVINDNLKKSPELDEDQIRNATDVATSEWFKVSSVETANPLNVEDYLDYFEELSTSLLSYMVNVRFKGNTAMHYAVSHANFDVVSILLDSKVCYVNQTNQAGYTCVMLVSLARLKVDEHRHVVQRLFQLSDVNIRATKHSQTALMLAVSHGNLDMVQMLVESGADINIQDDDGSTALMCAAEHGHIDIVKYLLAQPDCDSTKQDVDGSTALKISLETGFHDIGCLLYAHTHVKRQNSGGMKRDSSNTMSSSTSSLH